MRYQSQRAPDTALRGRLRDMANERRRFGYRRLFVLLKQEGEASGTLRRAGCEVGSSKATVARGNTGDICAVCADGTGVQGTFVIGSGTASGSGNGTDTNDNVYKLLF